MPSWLVLPIFVAAALSWPAIMAALLGVALWSGWRRRWWRVLLALLTVVVMLGWSAGLPAWQKQRLQTALNMGPYQPGELPDLRGSSVVLLGSVESRRWDSECVGLIKNGGVRQVWQADDRVVPAPPQKLPIHAELLPPGPDDDLDCTRRAPVMGETVQADWALLLPDRLAPHFKDQTDWSRLFAHFGDKSPGGLQPDYMLIRMGQDGSLDINDTVLAGFRGLVVARAWWYNPMLPQFYETLYPQPNSGRAAFFRLICGYEGGCGL